MTMTKTEQKSLQIALRYQAAEPGNGIAKSATNRSKCSRLREVRAALRRIDEGAFGMCIDCGEMIDPKRLAAAPWTAHCIVCQKATDCENAEPPRWFDTATFIAARASNNQQQHKA